MAGLACKVGHAVDPGGQSLPLIRARDVTML
jgi:hypothetical protein